MIDFAVKDDINRLSALWRECFGDDEDYIRNFMKNRFIPRNTVVYRSNGDIRSQLFLLEGDLRIKSQKYHSLYVYAACTQQAYRGRGLMTALLDKVNELAHDRRADYVCLVPGEPELFDFYRRFGFITAFKKKRVTLERRRLEIIADGFAEPSEPNYLILGDFRSRCISSSDAFLWDGNAVEYAAKENLLIGGGCVYYGEPIQGYAFLRSGNDGACVVYECCADENVLPKLLRLILNETRAESFTFYLPLDFPLGAESDGIELIENAMLLPVSDRAQAAFSDLDNAYFGLALE